jgi:hypothetical protein
MTLEATLLWKKPDALVAVCQKGELYWFFFKARGPYASWQEGELVIVHHYPGLEQEVICFERVKDLEAEEEADVG